MAKLMTMQKIYLDFPTIRTLLRGRSAIIHAEVHLADYAQTAHGSVFLFPNGAICGCIIEGESGRLLNSGEVALAKLAGVAEWSVSFTTSVEQDLQENLRRLTGLQPGVPSAERRAEIQDETQRGEASQGGGTPLRRLQPVVPDLVLDVLSLKDRLVLKTVWSMVNDYRSLGDIQALLRLSPAMIADAVESLRTFHVIDNV